MEQSIRRSTPVSAARLVAFFGAMVLVTALGLMLLTPSGAAAYNPNDYADANQANTSTLNADGWYTVPIIHLSVSPAPTQPVSVDPGGKFAAASNAIIGIIQGISIAGLVLLLAGGFGTMMWGGLNEQLRAKSLRIIGFAFMGFAGLFLLAAPLSTAVLNAFGVQAPSGS